MKKNKFKLIFFFILIFSIFFVYVWNVVDQGYDKQNKIILFLKKIIPTSISRKIRDTVFLIPDLKTLNKNLELQVKKYEQGLEGNIYFKEEIELLDKKTFFKKFFLPFPRLDVRAGYQNKSNTFRAHYLEIVEKNIIAISGDAKTIFFEKKNIFKSKLEQKVIKNNLIEMLKSKNQEFAGIRDLFYYNNMLYVSVIVKNKKGYSFDIYFAEVNFNDLNFKKFFSTESYFEHWSPSSGGRIEKYKEDKIIMSLGYSNVSGSPQSEENLLGKIFSINSKTKELKILSKGHRNPQGLLYDEKFDLIINTEHGPMGGDEINFNYVNNNKIRNFGYDIVSYGIEYDGSDPYKRPHSTYGFEEPFKHYTPSIGISEAILLRKNEKFKKNVLIVSSLRAGSLYVIELDEKLKKIESEKRIYLGDDRIRDLKFDSETNTLFLILEMTPSIGVVEINN